MRTTAAGGWREAVIVLSVATGLTVLMIFPIALRLGQVGRVDNADGQLSIWNVAWVARTLVVDPLHVFDANIFYPHRRTLGYSEPNLGAGALAIPAYWISRNAYAAHNFVVVLAFLASAMAMYYLVRFLTGDRRGAAVSAICFAFTPHLFAHLPHIQLLMSAGLPLSMLAFHRSVERPTAGRGAALGGALAGQALCCGYYGVFAILMVGLGVVIVASLRGLWLDRRFWMALGVGAVVSVVLVAPALILFSLQGAEGVRRPLEAAASFSANWSAYLASSSYAHAWMLKFVPRWSEVVFPGFVAIIFGIANWVTRGRDRGELTWLYGGLTALALWASFGPSAGLYSGLYYFIPMFGWLRAPARFGLLVSFGLSVLAGLAMSHVAHRIRHGTLVSVVVAMVAAAELVVPLNIPEALPVEPVYKVLATLPRGPVIEMPFWYLEGMFPKHTYYMLQSTVHWMPLVNGYSDYIPPDFGEDTLKFFPSGQAFKLLETRGVRYAVFHMYWYNDENRRDVVERLKQFEPYLRPLYADEGTRLYEIVGFPP